MGASSSQTSEFIDYPQELKDLLASYQRRNQLNDQRFEAITVYTSRQNSSEMIAVKESWANSIPASIKRNNFVSSRQHPKVPGLAR